MRSRKGLEAIGVVGTLVIVAFVILILMIGPVRIIATISAFFGSCWGGELIKPEDYGLGATYDPADWQEILSDVPRLYAKQEDKDKICVIPASEKAKQQQKEEGKPLEEQKPKILVTLDDSITPIKDGQDLAVTAHRMYTMHVRISGFTDEELNPRTCTFRLVNLESSSEDPLYFAGGDPPRAAFDAGPKETKTYRPKPAKDPWHTLTSCFKLKQLDFPFIFEEKHTQKKFRFEIRFHSPTLVFEYSNANRLSDSAYWQQLEEARKTDTEEASLVFDFKPISRVRIEGLPLKWEKKAELKVTCLVPCSDVTLGLVEEPLPPSLDTSSLDPKGQSQCEQKMAPCPQPPCPDVYKRIQNLPPNTDPVLKPDYTPVEVSLRPTKLDSAKNALFRSTFTLDHATFKHTFKRTTAETIVQTHLCVKVDFDQSEPVIKATEQPLLIDAEPPTLDSSLVKIQYQTLNGGLLTLTDKYDKSTFLNNAGLVVPSEACTDERSGCAKIYYTYNHIGDITPTNDLIGKIMNEVFQHLFTQSLTDEDCLVNPGTARYAAISFEMGKPAFLPINQKGRGYACIAAEDQAGNRGKPRIVKYFNPYDSLPSNLLANPKPPATPQPPRP